jgi:PAS domain S-box-containing protein
MMFDFKDFNIDLLNAINALSVNIYMKDKSGKFIWCNINQLENFGLTNINEIIGKTEYDLRDKDNADRIYKYDNEVISSGKVIVAEERGIEAGKEKIYMSRKSPLLDLNGNIIGIVGVSLDLTEQMNKVEHQIKSKEQKEKSLEYILSIMPAHIYWKDINGVYLGCNDLQAKNIGLKDRRQIIGKTDFDISENEKAARKFQENDFAVMSSGKNIIVEETVIINKARTPVLSYKVPLKDESGQTIGMAGISLDMTFKKEAEQLKIENDAYAAQRKEQAKIINFIDKIMNEIQNFRVEHLSEKLGTNGVKITESDKNIKLTKREREVLYFLSLNRSPKEIAAIISMLQGKEIQDSTINALINKQLYPKFDVFSVGQLIEKANALKLIPFLDNQDNFI